MDERTRDMDHPGIRAAIAGFSAIAVTTWLCTQAMLPYMNPALLAVSGLMLGAGAGTTLIYLVIPTANKWVSKASFLTFQGGLVLCLVCILSALPRLATAQNRCATLEHAMLYHRHPRPDIAAVFSAMKCQPGDWLDDWLRRLSH